MDVFAWWRQRQSRSRARAEAEHLSKEARRILKKKSYRIPESVAANARAAIDEIEEAMRGSDEERLRKAISDLDALMDKHLAFARKSTLREYAESIGVAVGVALLLRAFVVEAFQIPSGSMIPTLEVGDHIFVSKFAYGVSIPFTTKHLVDFSPPKRGDVIVFKYPRDPSTDYIKRVVGLPGEVVEVRENEVFIDGKPMPREHLDQACTYSDASHVGVRQELPCERWTETLDGHPHATIQDARPFKRDDKKMLVPPGHVFVMGDNRDNSSDSRYWGTVPMENIKGRALVIWWSRAQTDGTWGVSPSWWSSIRWGRFFSKVM